MTDLPNGSPTERDEPNDRAEGAEPRPAGSKPRRRGSRGGRNRTRPRPEGGETAGATDIEMPDLPREGRPATVEAAEASLVRRPAAEAVRKPQIGDSMPAPAAPPAGGGAGGDGPAKRKRRRGGRGRGSGGQGGQANPGQSRGQQHQGPRPRANAPVEAVLPTGGLDLDDDVLESRRGRERKGRPVGRYLMCVHVDPKATQIAVLEGRALLEHYVSRPSDDVSQIHGNIYLGKVQNVLPGMEAAFVDISTPKNAVLYRGDVVYDPEDVDQKKSQNLKIEQMLRPKQTIVCQVSMIDIWE
jgi:ribonuclease E